MTQENDIFMGCTRQISGQMVYIKAQNGSRTILGNNEIAKRNKEVVDRHYKLMANNSLVINGLNYVNYIAVAAVGIAFVVGGYMPIGLLVALHTYSKNLCTALDGLQGEFKMDKSRINIMIGKILEEEKIEPEELIRGICTLQQLRKIEKGDANPDFLLMEILVQRLGRSMDSQETIMPLTEYEQIELRDDILDDLCQGRLGNAEKKLEGLDWGSWGKDDGKEIVEEKENEGKSHKEKGDAGKEVVCCMYYYKLRGILEFEKKDYASAKKHFRRAAELTMGKAEVDRFLKGKADCPLRGRISNIEIETLILLAQVRLVSGQSGAAGNMLHNLLAYVEKQMKDGSAKARSMPKIAVLLADIYYRRGNYDACIKLCWDALTRLRKYGMTSCMTPLLGLLADAYGKTGQDRAKIRCWKEVIEQLYAHFNLNLEAVNKLYFNPCTCQFYLVGEMVREERLALGLSQELLIAKGGYRYPESLSRVESGTMPRTKTLEFLSKELGIRKERYVGRIITSDYVLLVLYHEIAVLQMRKEYKEVEILLEVLKENVDLTIVENRQLIEGLMIDIKRDNEIIDENVAIRETIELLKLTYKPGSRRVPYANEALLINQLCYFLVYQRKYEEAITWQKQTVELYQRSRVKLRYHFYSVYLIIDNMSRNMVHIENEEAEKWATLSIQAQLQNGKGNAAHLCLNSLIGTSSKKEPELCKNYVRWAYYLTEIFNMEHDQKLMKQYFEEKFKEEIN